MSTHPKAARCGTASGWRRHKDRNETPCDACARAKAEYDRRRRTAGDNTVRNRLHAKAQQKALLQLRRRYADEYEELYAAWKARVFAEAGIDPRWDLVRTKPKEATA